MDASGNWRDAIKGEELKQLILPAALAGLAVAVRFGMVFVGPASGTGHTLAGMGIAVATMAMNTITLLIAVGIVARFTGAELGPLPVTIIKLVAAAILGSVVMGLVAYSEMKGVGASAIAVNAVALVYWVMFSIFLEMDLQENLMAVVIACILQSGAICMLSGAGAAQ